ncbi:MAG: conjugal transfer protein TraX [Tatlockia sp.]|nr:conjugal transfer protein TraX [Tatlockia sp.]
MEAVKWLALLSMTIDHINRFFFNASNYPAYCAGRLAMPLFAFILAYNLAQPETLSRGLYSKVLLRLLIFGLLATPGYIAMRHLPQLYPLNIMFMLGTAVAVFYYYEQQDSANRIIALFIFLIGGFFVEYDWVGIIFCFASWSYCRKASLLTLLGWFVAYLLLDIINNNHWALLSIAIIYFATIIDVKIPRIRYLFYIYYPLHLSFLYLLTKLR